MLLKRAIDKAEAVIQNRNYDILLYLTLKHGKISFMNLEGFKMMRQRGIKR